MKRHYTIMIFLSFLTGHSLVISGPSGRSKSKVIPKPNYGSFVQETYKKESTQTQSIPPQAPLEEPKREIQQPSGIAKPVINTTISEQPLEQKLSEEETENDDTEIDEPSLKAPEERKELVKQKTIPLQDPLYELFIQKIDTSSYLTEGIIQYVFENVFAIMEKSEKDPKMIQEIKRHFYGLRYPLYRHLREVVSACSDPHAFLCGGIIESIAKSDNDPAKKKALFSALNRLGAQLKKFKLHQIDNKLEEELEEHLGKLQEIINGPNINPREKELIDKYYILPLDLLKKSIAIPEIKAILPPRESTAHYVYRKGAKKVVNAGTAVGQWLSKRIAVLAAKKLFNYYNTLIPKNLKLTKKDTNIEEEVTNSVIKGVTYPFRAFAEARKKSKMVADKLNLISEISDVEKTVTASFSKIYAAWKKPQIILDKIKSITQILHPGILRSMKSGVCSLLFTVYETSANALIKATFPFLTRKTIGFIKKMGKSNVKFITPPDLEAGNINVMTESAAFIIAYTQALCNAIVKENADIHKTVAALQSAQIEIYRHRRTIISEVSNSHAFTYSYFGYLHALFAKKFTAEMYESIEANIRENILDITDDELEEQADMIVKERIKQKNVFFNITGELTESDKMTLSALQSKKSSDPDNNNDIMYFVMPISQGALGTMIQTFEVHRKKIVEELKSFGARSKNQYIQNYWLSVIDQSYANNLKKHLETIKADLKAMMNDANHRISFRDHEGDIYTYNDGEPITIPAPKVPQTSAQELETIITTFYITPLEHIVAILQQDEIAKKLPANKSWYLRYPLYATKANISLQKQVISAVIDQITIENLIAAGQAFASGGLSAVPAALLNSTSFTSVALTMLDIDFTNPPPTGSYVSSAAYHQLTNVLMSKGPQGIKKYFEGKGLTDIATDIVKESGPVKKIGKAWRAHQRITRSY